MASAFTAVYDACVLYPARPHPAVEGIEPLLEGERCWAIPKRLRRTGVSGSVVE